MMMERWLGAGDEVVYGLPAEVRVERAHAAEVLSAVGVFGQERALEVQWSEVRRLAQRVVIRGRDAGLVMVVGAGGEATLILPRYLAQSRVFVPTCERCGAEAGCPHRLAAALALAWGEPTLRAVLGEPAWRRALRPFVREAGGEVEGERARGWIRAILLAPEEADDRPGRLADGMLRLELVRISPRTGKALKPREAPKTMAALENHVQDLPPADRDLCILAEQRRLFDHARTYRYADSVRMDEAVARLDAELFARLGDVTEVYFEERPVTVSREARVPALEVHDAPEGGLRLQWAVGTFRAVFPVGPGYVLDGERVLRPLPPDLPPTAAALLRRPLPVVPAEDVEAFIEDFALRTALPLEIRTSRVPAVGGRPRPRLMLSDEGGALRVEVRFAYGDVEVPAGAGGALVRVTDVDGEERLVRRDPEAEAAAVTALDALLPAPGATLLEADDAFDFLLDGVPKLEGWEVFVDDVLRARRPRGRLEPQARFSSGVDWFDLDVAFTADGVSVPAAAVLKSWRRGDRYHRLKDGGVVRLPDRWLERHGDELEELLEVRSARRGRLGLHAAPLAAGLLDEAPASEERARWRALADRLAAVDRVPDRAPPAGLTATLRAYQRRGFRWLVFLRDLGLGGVLADDMGLGKTVQTLALLLDTHGAAPDGPPSLVVAPTSVVHNWVQEAARFAADLRVHLHHGTARGAPPDDADVVVTSYALLRTDAETLTKRPWRYVVLDEAQHVKNPDSQVARAARALDARHRLALTGTPLENHLLELWSIFEFLMPGFFGSRRAFTARYVHSVQRRRDEEALAALRRRTRPFVLRRLKREVAAELPPRQEQVLWCELGPDQRRLYQRVKETYRDSVLSRVEERGVEGSTIQVLEALMRLRQACCDPRLLPFDEARAVTGSAKLELLLETLDEVTEEGHRTLVFSQWPSLLKLVAAELDARGIGYLYLDGATKQRADLQARWNREDGPPVFLISLKAGGTGLNLTGADHVIHLDPWWNPAVEAQATDRAHRIGQTRPVIVYKLVARDTVEEKILELQERKRALFDATVDADRLLVDGLTRADLEAVFADD